MRGKLTPYEKHANDGFGAIVSAFEASAETLIAAEKDNAERHDRRRRVCTGDTVE